MMQTDDDDAVIKLSSGLKRAYMPPALTRLDSSEIRSGGIHYVFENTSGHTGFVSS